MKLSIKFTRLIHPLVVCLVGLFLAVPFYWLIISSLKTPVEVVAYPPSWLPSEVRLANIPDAMALLTVKAFINSIIFAVSVTALQLILSITTGFAIAKMRFPGRKALLWLFVFTLFVPFQILLIPTFLIIRKFDWIDTWQGLVLPVVAQTSFGVFVFRQFYVEFSEELLDAARIDGANWGQVFIFIVVPLSLPAVAAYVSVTLLTAWNMFIWPLVSTTTIDLRVLPIALSALVTQRAQITPNIAMMAVLISTLPVVLVFIALQKYFVNGLVGGLKE